MKEKQPTADQRMSMRVMERDKERFRNYCSSYHLRQADGFSRLLSQAATEPGEDILRLSKQLKEAEQKNAALQKKNQQMYALMAMPGNSQPERNARDALMLVKQAVGQYLDLMQPQGEVYRQPIKPMRYDRLRRTFPNIRAYQYPEEERAYVVEVEALAWGKSRLPVLFAFGKAEDGAYLKFRYYPKKEFVGYSLRDYAQTGSVWMLAGKKALDGAVDLMAALPLPKQVLSRKRGSLDALIAAAQEEI